MFICDCVSSGKSRFIIVSQNRYLDTIKQRSYKGKCFDSFEICSLESSDHQKQMDKHNNNSPQECVVNCMHSITLSSDFV